jgi:iron complex transport system substrate-binding protein
MRSLYAGFFLLCLVGCGGAGAVDRPAAGVQESAAGERQRADSEPTAHFPLTLTDGLGRRVIVHQAPKRIVSIAPKNTEMLFAIGAGENVVGVTSFCNFPPEAHDREKVGGFAASSLSIEKIVGLRPDLVVTAAEFQRLVVDELDRLGITVFALAAESFDGLCGEMDILGRITGRQTEAGRVIDGMRSRFERVRTATAAIPASERVSVFCEISDEPFLAAGPKSFIGEMIEACGGVNIMHDARAAYPHVNPEVLLERSPAVILIPSEEGRPPPHAGVRVLPAWNELPAVQNGRVYYVDRDLVSRCGPRMVQAMEVIARLFYPDRFDEAAGDGSHLDDAESRDRQP